MIGYFKEDIHEELTEEERRLERNTTKDGSSNVYLNATRLFTKDFVMMKHPKVRQRSIHGDDD